MSEKLKERREGCCGQYRKPCAYHEGWEDALDIELGGLVQPCDQCGGSGTVVDRSDTEVDGETVVACAFGPCPSCSGRGKVVSDQAVKAGAEAAHRSRWRRAYLPTWDSELETVKDEYRHAARAVLAAAIFGEETE